MINFCEVIRGTDIGSCGGFYLMLTVARECLRLGETLDISELDNYMGYVQGDLALLDYFRELVSLGAIVGFSDEDFDYIESLLQNYKRKSLNKAHSMLYLDTDLYPDVIKGGYLYWKDKESGNNIWLETPPKGCPPKYNDIVNNKRKLSVVLMHMVGHYVLRYYFDPSLPVLEIRILSEFGVNSLSDYIYLLFCEKTLTIFKSCIRLSVDYSYLNEDLSFYSYWYKGWAAGKVGSHSVSDKLRFMREENILTGGIYIVWKRKISNDSCNSLGVIQDAFIARLDNISESGTPSLFMTLILLNKTKEEVLDDYYQIPEEKRGLYVDILQYRVNTKREICPLVNIAISNHLGSEEYIIDRIDPLELVTKKITVGGRTANTEMSGIDAIYWLLCQYGVQFNRDLYNSLYCEVGQELLWDMYGG